METQKDWQTACPEPVYLAGQETTGAAFPDYSGHAQPWQEVDWRDAGLIPTHVPTNRTEPSQVFSLSVHATNFAGLTSGGTFRVVLDVTRPAVLGSPRATVVDYTTIELEWAGVFEDPESEMDWFEWEVEHTQRLHGMYWTNTTGSPVPGRLRPAAEVAAGALGATLRVRPGTFTANALLRLRVHGVNRAGLRATSNDTLFWVDFTPPEVQPGTAVLVGRPGVGCWDRVSGPFTGRWDRHFHDPHTWVERYAWAVGTPADPEKYLPFTDVGTALTQTATLTFEPGDDVAVTVRATNPMGLQTVSASRTVRVDPKEVRPAWPLPVRDLPLGLADADADADFQADRAGLRAAWAGWWSEFGWILEYRIALVVVNGTVTTEVCVFSTFLDV